MPLSRWIAHLRLKDANRRKDDERVFFIKLVMAYLVGMSGAVFGDTGRDRSDLDKLAYPDCSMKLDSSYAAEIILHEASQSAPALFADRMPPRPRAYSMDIFIWNANRELFKFDKAMANEALFQAQTSRPKAVRLNARLRNHEVIDRIFVATHLSDQLQNSAAEMLRHETRVSNVPRLLLVNSAPRYRASDANFVDQGDLLMYSWGGEMIHGPIAREVIFVGGNESQCASRTVEALVRDAERAGLPEIHLRFWTEFMFDRAYLKLPGANALRSNPMLGSEQIVEALDATMFPKIAGFHFEPGSMRTTTRDGQREVHLSYTFGSNSKLKVRVSLESASGR